MNTCIRTKIYDYAWNLFSKLKANICNKPFVKVVKFKETVNKNEVKLHAQSDSEGVVTLVYN